MNETRGVPWKNEPYWTNYPTSPMQLRFPFVVGFTFWPWGISYIAPHYVLGAKNA